MAESWADLAAQTADIDTKAVIIREGSSLRTADELAECFIDDACGLLDCNQENLSNADEEDRSQVLSDTAAEYEARLDAAGYTTVWNDGFVIYKDLTDEQKESLQC